MRLKVTEKQANMIREDDENSQLRHSPDKPKLSDIVLFYDDVLGYFLGRDEWDDDLSRYFPYSKNSGYFKTADEACEAFKNKKYAEVVEGFKYKSAQTLTEEMNQNSLGDPCEYAAKQKGVKVESCKKKPVIKLKKAQIDRLFEGIAPDNNTGITTPSLPDGIEEDTIKNPGHPIAGDGGKEYNPQSIEQNKKTTQSFNEAELNSNPYEIYVNDELKGSAISTGDLKNKTTNIIKKTKTSPADVKIVVKYENSASREYPADYFLSWLDRHQHLNMEAYKMNESLMIKEDISVIGSLMEFAKHVIEFLNNLLKDPSNNGMGPFWHQLGISRKEILKMMSGVGLITTGGYKVHVIAKNFKTNIRKLYSEIKGSFSREDEQPLPEDVGGNSIEGVKKPIYQNETKESNYSVIYLNDEIAILKNPASALYFFFYSGIDKKDFMEYADVQRTYVGRDGEGEPDYDYDENFEIDADTIKNYVNDSLNELTVGEGVESYDKGDDLVQIDMPLKEEILRTFHNERLKNILDLYVKDENLEETTTAASSGSFTAPISFNPEQPTTSVNSTSPDSTTPSSVIKRPIGGMINASVLASLITLAEAKMKIRKDGSAAQVKKDTLNYRKSDNENLKCSKCTHNHDDTNQCDRVIAKVSPDYICNSYEVKAVKEETSAASSGSYTQPAIWAKDKSNMRFGKKAVWPGGSIIESLHEATNPNGFGRVTLDSIKLGNRFKIGDTTIMVIEKIYQDDSDTILDVKDERSGKIWQQEINHFLTWLRGVHAKQIERKSLTSEADDGKHPMPQKDTPEWHQLQVARKTLNTPSAILGVMGGMTIEQAKAILAKYGIKIDETIEESNFDSPSYGGNEKSGGGFVHLDPCVKLNNNKEAQQGRCSKGAVDKVVKVDKTNKSASIY